MPSTKLLATSQRMTRDDLADLLVGIAERVRTGEVVLRQGEESLTLEMPESVDVDVEVTSEDKTSGTKIQLEIEIEWYEGQQDQSLSLG